MNFKSYFLSKYTHQNFLFENSQIEVISDPKKHDELLTVRVLYNGNNYSATSAKDEVQETDDNGNTKYVTLPNVGFWITNVKEKKPLLFMRRKTEYNPVTKLWILGKLKENQSFGKTGFSKIDVHKFVQFADDYFFKNFLDPKKHSVIESNKNF